MKRTQKALKAWEVCVDDIVCIVFALTAPKAKWIGVRSYWDVFSKNGWPKLSVKRKPIYDNSPLKNDPRKFNVALSESYVLQSMQERINQK